MRVMVLVKATADSEAGLLPTTEQLNAMGAFNSELADAGVLLAGEGLKASSGGVRVQYGDGGSRSVVDGPFAETKELIAGFWILQVASVDEAVEWLKRAPFDPGQCVEIRPVLEVEDFGAALTPELQEAEARLRARAEGDSA